MARSADAPRRGLRPRPWEGIHPYAAEIGKAPRAEFAEDDVDEPYLLRKEIGVVMSPWFPDHCTAARASRALTSSVCITVQTVARKMSFMSKLF